MDYEILKALLFNVMLMISFLYMLGKIKPLNSENKSRGLKLLLISFMISILSFLCMVFPVYENPNYIFDLRSNPIMLLGMCEGFVPALIASVIPSLYRIYLGGSTVYYGVMYGTIVPALMGGTCYWVLKIKRKKASLFRNLNGLGLVIMGSLLYLKDLILFSFSIPQGREMLHKTGICMPFIYILTFILMGAIIRDNYRLTQHQHILKEEAMTDELTRLKNYRYIVNCLYNIIDEEGNKFKNLSFMMIDIDKFKVYNDTFGHNEGNKALKAVSRVLIESTRKGDIVTRYGGEEFLVVLKDANTKGAYRIAERIRKNVSKLGSYLGGGTYRRNITVSVGISSYPVHGSDVHDLINKADKALYIAKENGRNNVQIYSESNEDTHRFGSFMVADKMQL